MSAVICRELGVELLVQDASCFPPSGGFLGMPHWEEIWNSLDGSYIHSRLGAPWNIPGGFRECHEQEGCLSYSPCDQTTEKEKNGWMETETFSPKRNCPKTTYSWHAATGCPEGPAQSFALTFGILSNASLLFSVFRFRNSIHQWQKIP